MDMKFGTLNVKSIYRAGSLKILKDKGFEGKNWIHLAPGKM
jgi:hypothetical protein